MNVAVIETIIPSGFMFHGALLGLLALYLIMRFRDKKPSEYRGA